MSLHDDGDGSLWISTYGGGLNRLKGNRITSYTTVHGMVSDVVYRTLSDRQGNLWMSTNSGIFRVSKREIDALDRGATSILHPFLLDSADGMRSSECNGGSQSSGCQTRDGRLWFPTMRGVVVVDPAHLTMHTRPPPVIVERILVDGAAVDPRQDIDGPEGRTVEGTALPQGPLAIVPPGARRIEVEYTGLSFIAPERMRFTVKLTGFDPDWVQVGSRRVAAFSRLPPGRYRFQVRAANSDGVWNEEGAEVVLVQQPFFYQTRLFYVLAALGTVFLGLAIHLGRVRRLRARARDLTSQVDAALAKIKVLSGLLPICAWCKKIRDDHGQWNQMETFIRNRSEAEFTHGICPECMSRIASEKLGPPAGPDPGPVE